VKSIFDRQNLKIMATGKNVVLTNNASEKLYSILHSIPETRMMERVQYPIISNVRFMLLLFCAKIAIISNTKAFLS
jgi:hypothetical protein